MDATLPSPPTTRDALLDAALRVFAEQGARAARMEDIAVSAGVSRATLYYHFRSREALVDALLERGVGELAEAVVAACADDEPVDAPLRAAIRLFGERAELVRILVPEVWALHEEPEVLAARLEELVVAPYAERLARGTRAGEVRACDPKVAAAALMGLVEGAVGGPVVRGEELDLAHLEAELVALARAALDPRG